MTARVIGTTTLLADMLCRFFCDASLAVLHAPNRKSRIHKDLRTWIFDCQRLSHFSAQALHCSFLARWSNSQDGLCGKRGKRCKSRIGIEVA